MTLHHRSGPACVNPDSGSSLLELVIASAIASVGTLAVFTLFLHWYPQLDALASAYQTLNDQQLERSGPDYIRRVELFQCEADEGDQAGLIIE